MELTPPQYLWNLCYFGLTFYTALLLSLVFTALSAKVAWRVGALDLPDHRKVHTEPIPRLGGAGMALSVLLTVGVCVNFPALIRGYLAGLVLVWLTGVLDDMKGLTPGLKFLGELLAATTFVLLSGIHLSHFGNLPGFGELRLGAASVPVTIVGIVGVMNALNLSDGLDGLAAGIATIACVFFIPLSYVSRHAYLMALLTILIGVIIGFVRYNQHPARVFMGDTGSLLLGYTLGVVAVGLSMPHAGGQTIRPITILTVCSVPIVDTLYVMIQRILHGRYPFGPDRTHLHHRLMHLGLSHPLVVTVIYGLCVFVGIVAWLQKDFSDWIQFANVFALFAALYGALAWAEKKGVKVSSIEVGMGFAACRPEGHLPVLRGGSFVGALLCIALLAPVVFLASVPRPMGLFALGVPIFVFLLFPWFGSMSRMPLTHALVFWSIFSILVLYQFIASPPPWLKTYLTLLSILCFCGVLLRFLLKPVGTSLVPTGLEFLLIAISWLIPMVWGTAFDVDPVIQEKLFRACFLAIPMLVASKMVIKKSNRGNVQFVLGLQLVMIIFGLKAFWS